MGRDVVVGHTLWEGDSTAAPGGRRFGGLEGGLCLLPMAWEWTGHTVLCLGGWLSKCRLVLPGAATGLRFEE